MGTETKFFHTLKKYDTSDENIFFSTFSLYLYFFSVKKTRQNSYKYRSSCVMSYLV